MLAAYYYRPCGTLCTCGERGNQHGKYIMTTTVPATYEGEILKLMRPLPLPLHTLVRVTVETLPASECMPAAPANWPNISARLKALYGDKTMSANAVVAARDEERY